MDEKPITVNVIGGQVGVINLGDVQGSINASVQSLVRQGEQQEQVANAIRDLAAAISGSGLTNSQKKEALDVIDTVATQAKEPPEKRNLGIVKALLVGLPSLISAAKGATDLWDKFGPMIRGHFGL